MKVLTLDFYLLSAAISLVVNSLYISHHHMSTITFNITIFFRETRLNAVHGMQNKLVSASKKLLKKSASYHIMVA